MDGRALGFVNGCSDLEFELCFVLYMVSKARKCKMSYSRALCTGKSKWGSSHCFGFFFSLHLPVSGGSSVLGSQKMTCKKQHSELGHAAYGDSGTIALGA